MLVNDYQLGNVGRLPARRNYPGYSGFGAFGTASTYQPGDCPASGSWETWCDCVFQPGTRDNSACRNKPFLAVAPWTVAGAIQRGIPNGSAFATLVNNYASSLKQIGTSASNAIVSPSQPNAGPPPAPVAPAAPASAVNSLFTTMPGGGSFMPTSEGGKAGLAIAAVAGIGLVALLVLKKK